jgi:hypothetical protein
MKRGDVRAELTVMRLLNRFGDVKLSEAWDLLKRERNTIRKRGRPHKWDDYIAGDVYLMVCAIMGRGFSKTKSQEKLARFKHRNGDWFSFSEIVTGFKRGEAYLGKLSRREIQENTQTILEAMPDLKAYIDRLKTPA